MNRPTLLPALLTCTLALSIVASWSPIAGAQESAKQAKKNATESSQEWFYGDEAKAVEHKSLGQQKSIKRGEQRMARLEAMRWYGFSAGRPTASGLPYTSAYSPSWTRPGGRPFAWYTGAGPSVVINRPYRAYRY